MAVDALRGGMGTTRIRVRQGEEARLHAATCAAAGRYLRRTGNADLLEVLGLVVPAPAPPPELKPVPKPEPADPLRVRDFGQADCGSCHKIYTKVASNQQFCSTRCQKRARRERARRAATDD
jgi:hypothetical protein